MKKIFSISFMILLSVCTARAEIISDEEFVLNENEENGYEEILFDRFETGTNFKLNTGSKQKIYTKDNLNFDKNLEQRKTQQYANESVKKGNVTYTYSQKQGSSTYGTKYENTLAPDDITQSATIFKKYEKNKFSIDTSYKNKQSSLGSSGSGSVAVAPEYKINQHLSIKSVFSSEIQQDKKKNEVVFSIKPMKDDRMNLDLGAGKSYDSVRGSTGSQLNFSTKLRF